MSVKRIFASMAILLAVCSLAHGMRRNVAGSDKAVIYGTVKDNEGRPLAGVRLSDGLSVVLSGKDGRYAIDSDKRQGFVFVISPSGYTVPLHEDGLRPDFWQRLEKPAGETERHDFILVPQDQSRYHVLFSADMHIIHDPDKDDRTLLHELVVPTVKRLHEKYSADGPVFMLNLGDVSQDIYWYRFDCPIDSSYVSLLREAYPGPFYNLPGNHDNDPAVIGKNVDRRAEEGYRRCFGPTYYSMDIGNDHWIMMDNTIYVNTPLKPEKVKHNVLGKRDFTIAFTDDEMRWLENDLANVPEGMTLRICGHESFLFEYPEGKGTQFDRSSQMDSVVRMISKADGKMRAYTGHTHRMQFAANDIFPEVEDLMLPATSGNVWGSGVDRLLGIDASDAGIVIGHFSESGESYDYETFRFGEKWMRVYDMNAVSEFYRSDPTTVSHIKEYPMRTDYGQPGYENMVYANIWMWRPGDIVEMYEDGRRLEVEKLEKSDPLMLVGPNGNVNTYIKPQYVNCYHLFGARAAGPESDILIRIVDKDGRLRHEENFRRPASFDSNYR